MEALANIEGLSAMIDALSSVRHVGRVQSVKAGVVHVAGLAKDARIGDRISVRRMGATEVSAEVVQLDGENLIALPEATPDGVGLDDRAVLLDPISIAPANSWIGRVIDPSGLPLDGRPLLRGPVTRPLRAPPPPAAARRAMGSRLSTGLAVTNTVLPIVAGQRAVSYTHLTLPTSDLV